MLDFEYGVNTGNRFLQFVDHEEEPEEFIAAQTKHDEPTTSTTATKKKSSTKDSKTTTATKKVTSTTTTTTKTNKENLTSKSNNERRQPTSTGTTVFSDNQNQSTRVDSARGSRGAPGSTRRGTFDGNRGARSQRFQKFDGQPTSTTPSDDQSGRGRGGPSRRGLNRGGPSGRGRPAYLNNRTSEEGQTPREQFNDDSNFDANDQDVSPQDRTFEPDNNRRNYRGNYRPRPHHSNREGNEMSQEDQRANRRMHDRQPRNNVSGVKPIEKKDGEGAHNWGNPTENPEDHLVSEDVTEPTGQVTSWAQQMDEAEKQMTLDEYKKQLEAKKRAQQEKLPQFNTRTAGEGEDPKGWTKPVQVYRKKANAEQSDDEEEEEEEEEVEEDEDLEEEEQMVGKKKLINIPLHFKPIATGRGGSARGGRRGGNPRYRERNEQATSPEQGTTAPADESRRGAASASTGGYRRSYGNSARTSRSGRNQGDSNALALDNPEDFPTLPKQ